jgi:hypothetical protein
MEKKEFKLVEQDQCQICCDSGLCIECARGWDEIKDKARVDPEFAKSLQEWLQGRKTR